MCKITIEQKAGEDYPIEMKDNQNWHSSVEQTIRKRLELREKDEVKIIEI